MHLSAATCCRDCETRSRSRGLAGLGATLTSCPACELCRRNGGTWNGSACVYGTPAPAPSQPTMTISAPVSSQPPAPAPAPVMSPAPAYDYSAIQRAIAEANAYARSRSGEASGEAVETGAPAIAARAFGPPSATFAPGAADDGITSLNTGSLLTATGSSGSGSGEKKELGAIPWLTLIAIGFSLMGKG